jgi:hypothetical protein
MNKRVKDALGDQAKRFVQLKEQVAATTGLAIDAPRVTFLATLMLQAERLQSRVVAGDDSVTSAELLALRSTIEEVAPNPPHRVEIQIVEAEIQHCPKCGWSRDKPAADPPAPDAKPSTPPAKGKRLTLPPNPSVSTNVVPLK